MSQDLIILWHFLFYSKLYVYLSIMTLEALEQAKMWDQDLTMLTNFKTELTKAGGVISSGTASLRSSKKIDLNKITTCLIEAIDEAILECETNIKEL